VKAGKLEITTYICMIVLIYYLECFLANFFFQKNGNHEPQSGSYVAGTKEVMGVNHKVNSPKVSHNFPR